MQPDDTTRAILRALLERLANARQLADVNIAAGIAAQELDAAS